MLKVMVVDDEIEIAELIEDFLRIENIDVIKATSGEEALKLLDKTIQLIVLDINMSGMNGIELCKRIRKDSVIPIIFLTCNNTQRDMLLGLGVGADDYMTKPFNPIELVARIKVNIRRYQSYSKGDLADEIITFGDIVIYKKSYKVYKNTIDVSITPKEFRLLIYLIDNAYIVLSRQQILDHVWGTEFYDENLVNTTIKRLRKKIENSPDNPEYIQTIWGLGYMFQGEVR
ncbi:MAG: response regulator transcription factor [Tissierellales bacterium]|jgi:DNA-binding response OmpR family regulator|nr:response regulator transcription factor [Tissierellales bacterium]MBN2828573.1 response regulator transcription factor [Tissierellales bacterium]